VNARPPLAAAIVAVLGAGVALAVIRPGDLATDEQTLAQGPTTTTTPPLSTTTTTTSRPPTPPPAAEPGTGPGAGSTPETTAATPTTRPTPAPTTTAAPPPPASTTLPGDAGPPRLAHTGDPPLGAPLGLALVVAAGAARWASTRRARPQD
jgi:hypothetical protein